MPCRRILFTIISLGIFFSLHGRLRAQAVNCVYPPSEIFSNRPVPFPRLARLAKISASTSVQTTILKPKGQWRALVILVDFPDYPWNKQDDPNFNLPDTLFTQSYFQQMLFSTGSFHDPLSPSSVTGSMRDFYREASYGQFDVTGIVTTWVRADLPMKYYVNADGLANTPDDYGYGDYPQNVQGLVTSILTKIDPVVDFSEFDNTGDGMVDALFFVHAGPSAEEIYISNYAASFDYIWSHSWNIPPLKLDGVTLRKYTMEPANGTIGVFCHEFGHTFGLPDLYDPDNSSEGIGEWGLMSAGGWCHRAGDRKGTSPSQFTAWSKYKLGWADPVEINAGTQELVLEPSVTSPRIVLLRQPWMPTGEYFLLENRQPRGFDAGLTRRQKDFSLPDPSGLLILHVDEAHGNQRNDRRRLIDVEEASPLFIEQDNTSLEQLNLPRNLAEYHFLNKGNRGDNGDLFPGFSGVTDDLTDFLPPRNRDHFDATSVPASTTNDHKLSGIAVENIRQLPDGRISFLVQVGSVTSVRSPQSSAPLPPESFRLYPNPVANSAVLRMVGLVPNQPARLSVYDILGRKLGEIQRTPSAAGTLSLRLSRLTGPTPSLAFGIYFLRLQQKGRVLQRKFVIASE
ncbi:MAG: M6 family metalloprotease domain-containing protein [Calditrichaeota bacterium]|nr:MAG: M6 family metalloprotease domain-containing protein [Calditrichota bacterium]